VLLAALRRLGTTNQSRSTRDAMRCPQSKPCLVGIKGFLVVSDFLYERTGSPNDVFGLMRILSVERPPHCLLIKCWYLRVYFEDKPKYHTWIRLFFGGLYYCVVWRINRTLAEHARAMSQASSDLIDDGAIGTILILYCAPPLTRPQSSD
jgi:hypothetical protein